MKVDADFTRGASRLIYPELPDPLTAADLKRVFSPSHAEREWAPTIARSPTSQVVLLVQLKVFQAVGRCLSLRTVPHLIFEHVAHRLGVDGEIGFESSESTQYRHRKAILDRLGVTAWGTASRRLAHRTMITVAEARTDPAELINAAVDALVRHQFELPSLNALGRLAASVHAKVNAAQWQRIGDCVSEEQRSALEALLRADPATQESSFAQICRAPGRATRKNLQALLDRHRWLQTLPDPTPALQGVPDAKVLQSANEAKRLKAPELREYIEPRRHALLLAVIHQARGQVLDDLTLILLKLARKIERKSEQQFDEWYASRRNQTDALIRTFHDALLIHGTDDAPGEKIGRLEAFFASQGGRGMLEKSCAEHLRHERQTWRVFARSAFVPVRSALLRLADTLQLEATATSRELLSLIEVVATDVPAYSDYYLIADVTPAALPREWRSLVLDDPSDPDAFNRRQLEVVAILELAAAIQAGEMFVAGSLSYDRFWDRLPPETADPAAIAAYVASQDWGERAEGFIRTLKDSLDREMRFLEHAVGHAREARQRRPADCDTHHRGAGPGFRDGSGKAPS
jgi:Domain of unknown function (DUF4158)